LIEVGCYLVRWTDAYQDQKYFGMCVRVLVPVRLRTVSHLKLVSFSKITRVSYGTVQELRNHHGYRTEKVVSHYIFETCDTITLARSLFLLLTSYSKRNTEVMAAKYRMYGNYW